LIIGHRGYKGKVVVFHDFELSRMTKETGYNIN